MAPPTQVLRASKLGLEIPTLGRDGVFPQTARIASVNSRDSGVGRSVTNPQGFPASPGDLEHDLRFNPSVMPA